MSTDILIPLGKGSRHDNLELRYCLRSIEKHLKGVSNIFLVGELPEFINKLTLVYIPKKDNPNNWNRAKNIYEKIMAGCNYFDDLQFSQDKEDFVNNEVTASFICLSNDFLFLNDDHYLLSDYDAAEFPYYHRGVFDFAAAESNRPQYKQMLNTKEKLNPYLVYDFDVHCPILYNKHTFKILFESLTWPEYGYCIKSFYSNNRIDTTKWVPCEDLKFHEPLLKESIYRVLEGRQWFSIGDRCLRSGDMKKVLQELYPSPSKYEL